MENAIARLEEEQKHSLIRYVEQDLGWHPLFATLSGSPTSRRVTFPVFRTVCCPDNLGLEYLLSKAAAQVRPRGGRIDGHAISSAEGQQHLFANEWRLFQKFNEYKENLGELGVRNLRR